MFFRPEFTLQTNGDKPAFVPSKRLPSSHSFYVRSLLHTDSPMDTAKKLFDLKKRFPDSQIEYWNFNSPTSQRFIGFLPAKKDFKSVEEVWQYMEAEHKFLKKNPKIRDEHFRVWEIYDRKK